MNIIKKAGIIVVLIFVVFVLSICQGEKRSLEQASLILINGNVITINPQIPKAEAIAVKNDRIIKVGSKGLSMLKSYPPEDISRFAQLGVIPSMQPIHCSMDMGFTEKRIDSRRMKGAYAAFEEDIKGSLTPGKLADITVISKDILSIPEPDILFTEVLMTIVGGKIVYQKYYSQIMKKNSLISKKLNVKPIYWIK